ncbi:MAG: VOC family protein [Thermoleophilia bacterium]
MELLTLDHVALWVGDRDALAAFCCGHLGMHEIARTDAFTLVGSSARHGKLTLFAAEGPRERGALDAVGLRVPDLAAARAALPTGAAVAEGEGRLRVGAPEGLDVVLVERPGTPVPYDLDHVALRCADPDAACVALAGLGVPERDGRLEVAGTALVPVAGAPAPTGRPLLNHLGFRVPSADEALRRSEAHGVQVLRVVDAENTAAVFVQGPEDVVVEYVEHKPGFSLV